MMHGTCENSAWYSSRWRFSSICLSLMLRPMRSMVCTRVPISSAWSMSMRVHWPPSAISCAPVMSFLMGRMTKRPMNTKIATPMPASTMKVKATLRDWNEAISRSVASSESTTSMAPSTFLSAGWKWQFSEQPGSLWMGLMMPSLRWPFSSVKMRVRLSRGASAGGGLERWHTMQAWLRMSVTVSTSRARLENFTAPSLLYTRTACMPGWEPMLVMIWFRSSRELIIMA